MDASPFNFYYRYIHHNKRFTLSITHNFVAQGAKFARRGKKKRKGWSLYFRLDKGFFSFQTTLDQWCTCTSLSILNWDEVAGWVGVGLIEERPSVVREGRRERERKREREREREGGWVLLNLNQVVGWVGFIYF